jgi:hypothetical protein
VFPEHKFLIVEALRQNGYIVGMTGDGVNDAPALKRADVGIAVSGATDAARASADIVLTEPGLSTIATAIVTSRKIFTRMKNFVIYRVACTVQVGACSPFSLRTLPTVASRSLPYVPDTPAPRMRALSHSTARETLALHHARHVTGKTHSRRRSSQRCVGWLLFAAVVLFLHRVHRV